MLPFLLLRPESIPILLSDYQGKAAFLLHWQYSCLQKVCRLAAQSVDRSCQGARVRQGKTSNVFLAVEMPKRGRRVSERKRGKRMQLQQQETNYFEQMPDELVLKVLSRPRVS